MAASDGSSSGGAGDPQSDRDARIEEANIFNSFAALIRSRFADQTNVDRLDKLYQHPEYAAEKALLTEMNNNGMAAGIATGIGSLLFLRRGPRVVSSYMLRRAAQRGGGGGGAGGGPGGGAYRFDAPVQRTNPFEAANAASSSSSGAGQLPPRRPGILIRAFKLGLDLFVSSTLALYASAIYTDKRKLLQEASEIPLLEGRSMISDELCGDFMKHYGTMPQSTWEKYRDDGPDGRPNALGAIEMFVVNCRKRDMYERTVREERGLRPGGTGEHMSIPSPGVPRNLDVVLREIGRGGGSLDDDHGEGGAAATDASSFGNEFFSDGDGEDGVVNEAESLGEWTSIDDFDKGGGGKSDGAGSGGEKRGWGW